MEIANHMCLCMRAPSLFSLGAYTAYTTHTNSCVFGALKRMAWGMDTGYDGINRPYSIIVWRLWYTNTQVHTLNSPTSNNNIRSRHPGRNMFEESQTWRGIHGRTECSTRSLLASFLTRHTTEFHPLSPAIYTSPL